MVADCDSFHIVCRNLCHDSSAGVQQFDGDRIGRHKDGLIKERVFPFGNRVQHKSTEKVIHVRRFGGEWSTL